jgi:hypothetical protein
MKLSSLTPQDKIKLAAELDGWDYSPISDHASPRPFICHHSQMRVSFNYFKFDTSYDAIVPLIHKACQGNQELECKFITTLYEQEDHHELSLLDMANDMRQVSFWLLCSKPSQLLDALLVATGKAEL